MIRRDRLQRVIVLLVGVGIIVLLSATIADTGALWPAFVPLGGLLLVLLGVSSWRHTRDLRRAAVIAGFGLVLLVATVEGLRAFGLVALLVLAVWIMVFRPFRY